MNSPRTGIDWPLVGFFVLAFALAWGSIGVLELIAARSGIESGLRLFEMGEVMQFEGASLVVPSWVVYLITRIADFSFTIAGVVAVAVTAGREGLRELFETIVPGLAGTDWELVSFLGLLVVALVVTVSLVRSSNRRSAIVQS